MTTRVRLFASDSGVGVGVLRRQAQDQAEANEDAYRRLLEGVLDTAQDAVLVTLAEPMDAPGPIIVYANKSLLEQTGYALHECWAAVRVCSKGLKPHKEHGRTAGGHGPVEVRNDAGHQLPA